LITYFNNENLLNSDADVLVCTVNMVGVMGKGLALEVKRRWPEIENSYQLAIENGDLAIGRVWASRVGDLFDDKLILLFPTKNHWKNPSRMSYIDRGLESLVSWISDNNIKSIAIPPLGCGNGGLSWLEVLPRIETVMSEVVCEIEIYPPQ
jgi:O-acetyl-ADP-ribose deacetylase (regulator of RNase III)